MGTSMGLPTAIAQPALARCSEWPRTAADSPRSSISTASMAGPSQPPRWCREQSLWWIARIYLTRWKIEETFRFIKQSYNLEDIRVMKYQRLKNLVVLVTAAAYFAATFLGQKMKLRLLCRELLIVSQRFFGIPPFRFYALADGIKRILFPATLDPPAPLPPTGQFELLLGWES